MELRWNPQTTPPELVPLLMTLGEEYPIHPDADDNLRWKKSPQADRLQVRKRAGIYTITYGDRSFVGRGVGLALADCESDEKIFFTTHGIILDCSRTGVVKVEYFKRWLRRLALFGFNVAMIYTKDAYQLPDEPFFGYMRGAYTQAEIREIDAYAQKLNIEMIASIQALGHLEPVLRWNYYRDIKDTDNVLLVDSEKSYQLIRKMLDFWSGALSSRRIHLGMDETHDLGRGKFLDDHGYERGFDLYNRHLKKLCELCREYQFKPIIWNDMYFKFSSVDHTYYHPDTEIPDEVKAGIPAEVQTSYWDYYHWDRDFYCSMLKKSASLNGRAPLVASGIWTWGELWCDYKVTDLITRPCVDACRKMNLREIVYALWGDDGGYCEFESAFAALARVADYDFNAEYSEARTEKVFTAVCSADYRLQVALGDIQMPIDDTPIPAKVSAPALLWDDPLMQMYCRANPEIDWERVLTGYRALQERTSTQLAERSAGIIRHADNILRVLIGKIEIRRQLLSAYNCRDYKSLQKLIATDIPQVVNALKDLDESFRDQYLRSYKPFGLEIMQIRLAGLISRYRELARRLADLVENRIDGIDELDIPPTPETAINPYYRLLATGGYCL